jgi:tripartite-type tricarboxylate transporter receptor subunit TctC
MARNTGKLLATLVATTLCTTAVPSAAAQDKAAAKRKPTITIIVPSQGETADALARILVAPLGKALKQPVVGHNILGGGGTLGSEKASKAMPDGTTLLLSNIGQATDTALYRHLRYDPVGDFEPIGLVAEVPMILVARSSLPAKTLKELLAGDTTGLGFAHGGAGSVSHLCGLLFMNASRAAPRMIHYQGTQPALSDLVGGHVDLLCDQPDNVVKALRSGQLRAYGVTTRTRAKVLPQVPTLAEAGLPDVELVVWHGLYAPRGTPRETVERLAAGLRQALATPEVKAQMAQLGATPAPAADVTPAALGQRLRAEEIRWGQILRGAGVRAD